MDAAIKALRTAKDELLTFASLEMNDTKRKEAYQAVAGINLIGASLIAANHNSPEKQDDLLNEVFGV